MTDYFALMDEPRRPWIDPESIRSKFLSLSVAAHPDRVHAAGAAATGAAAEQFAQLNAAHLCLREPRARLRHLLELERGIRPAEVQRTPPALMDRFLEVGQLCQNLDRFLAGKAQLTAPMLKVRAFEQGLDWLDQIQSLQGKIADEQRRLEVELQAMNPAWLQAPPPGAATRSASLPLDRLEEIYRVISYFARWMAQLQERSVLLAL